MVMMITTLKRTTVAYPGANPKMELTKRESEKCMQINKGMYFFVLVLLVLYPFLLLLR